MKRTGQGNCCVQQGLSSCGDLHAFIQFHEPICTIYLSISQNTQDIGSYTVSSISFVNLID